MDSFHKLQIVNLIGLYRTLVNVVGEYFANEIVQSCGKVYETEVTKIELKVYRLFLTVHTCKIDMTIITESECQFSHFGMKRVISGQD